MTYEAKVELFNKYRTRFETKAALSAGPFANRPGRAFTTRIVIITTVSQRPNLLARTRYNTGMPDLSTHEVAALRFMKKNPIRVDPFSPVANVEAVVEMLDALAKMGLCRRTLEGLSRVYSITPEGLEALSKEAAEGDDQL